MRSTKRSFRDLTALLLLLLAPPVFTDCGGTGTDVAGGGTGGTGISTGAVTGFGSVVVNGVHYRTDGQVRRGYVTKKMFNGRDNSSRRDQDVFAVGMIVSVRHGASDDDAAEIDFQDNLEGAIEAKNAGADNTITVLGQTVVVDNAALFDSLGRDVVSVSGFADSQGRIRSAYLRSLRNVPRPGDPYEVKGFVSGLTASTFRLGPLPDGQGVTVTVSFDPAAISTLPGGPRGGMYVQVDTTDVAPDNGTITASRVGRLSPRTEFPEGAAVDLEGLVTSAPAGSGTELSFTVEGKRVQTDAATDFSGNSPSDIRIDARIQVHGTETSGVLTADRIVFR